MFDLLKRLKEADDVTEPATVPAPKWIKDLETWNAAVASLKEKGTLLKDGKPNYGAIIAVFKNKKKTKGEDVKEVTGEKKDFIFVMIRLGASGEAKYLSSDEVKEYLTGMEGKEPRDAVKFIGFDLYAVSANASILYAVVSSGKVVKVGSGTGDEGEWIDSMDPEYASVEDFISAAKEVTGDWIADEGNLGADESRVHEAFAPTTKAQLEKMKEEQDPYLPHLSGTCDVCGKEPVKFAGDKGGEYCSIKCQAQAEGKDVKEYSGSYGAV